MSSQKKEEESERQYVSSSWGQSWTASPAVTASKGSAVSYSSITNTKNVYIALNNIAELNLVEELTRTKYPSLTIKTSDFFDESPYECFEKSSMYLMLQYGEMIVLGIQKNLVFDCLFKQGAFLDGHVISALEFIDDHQRYYEMTTYWRRWAHAMAITGTQPYQFTRNTWGKTFWTAGP